MLVEHSFVSTRAADDAASAARSALEAMGAQVSRGGRGIHFERECFAWPIAGQLEYDRGRLTVAVGFVPENVPAVGASVLTAIAEGLEAHVAHGAELASVRAAFRDAVGPLERVHLRRRRASLIRVGILVSVLVALVVGLIVLLGKRP